MQENLCFIAFNRPSKTEETLRKLLLLKWDKVYVYLDGVKNIKDVNACSEVHKIIKRLLDESNVDYEITKQEKNLGCKRHIAYAITNFFKERSGWVFEDDVYLEDVEAFELVRKKVHSYKDAVHFGLHPFVENIFTQKPEFLTDGYSFIWGWYRNRPIDEILLLNPEFTAKNLFMTIKSRGVLGGVMLCYSVKRTLDGLIDTWDTLYDYYNIVTNVRCVTVSRKNIIKNIGINPEATHTTRQTIAWDIAKWIPIPYRYQMVAFRVLGKFI